MIIFTEKGWLAYKPVYVEELFNLLQSVTDESRKEVLEQLNQTHRAVVEMLLSRIGESQNIGFIKILDHWKVTEVKKVQTMINKAINKLKSV
ncbi:hypothetical protein [Fusibacter sp. 3D3]|uniref:hypothetical protein n=1 Tax=Fusibacter sp. 3D3 TaxID=1048380 RepID=UPI000855CDBA|nr:hypothetical protein [Fusibacter sp. 3D3]GAU78654.1 hypothetical protein F3D3_3289 [Fusibacter sp. 3D3]